VPLLVVPNVTVRMKAKHFSPSQLSRLITGNLYLLRYLCRYTLRQASKLFNFQTTGAIFIRVRKIAKSVY
jgi:hypothetical protein